MIYTVTVNPALDYVIQLEQFNNGDISRSNNCNFFAGGKGICLLYTSPSPRDD